MPNADYLALLDENVEDFIFYLGVPKIFIENDEFGVELEESENESFDVNNTEFDNFSDLKS